MLNVESIISTFPEKWRIPNSQKIYHRLKSLLFFSDVPFPIFSRRLETRSEAVTSREYRLYSVQLNRYSSDTGRILIRKPFEYLSEKNRFRGLNNCENSLLWIQGTSQGREELEPSNLQPQLCWNILAPLEYALVSCHWVFIWDQFNSIANRVAFFDVELLNQRKIFWKLHWTEGKRFSVKQLTVNRQNQMLHSKLFMKPILSK